MSGGSKPEDLSISHAEIGTKKVTVITDKTSRREWSGEADSTSEASNEAFQKFIKDRRVREYLPS